MQSVARSTALTEVHQQLGARMIEFAGFVMPISYGGILQEQEAVRHRAGIFDLSHMAQIEVSGPGAEAFLEARTCNIVATMPVFGARYNIVTNQEGGAHDDIVIYRLPDRFMIVANAANAKKIGDYFIGDMSDGVHVQSFHGRRSLIALQGPESLAILAPLVDVDLAAMKFYSCALGNVLGAPALIARTGYTGEDGFELFLNDEDAETVFRGLLRQGVPRLLEPVGLGARDVLRLEAGMPLYGNELDEDISPLQAGLDKFVKLEKGEFVGRAALQAEKQTLYPRMVGLILVGRTPARSGYKIFAEDGREVGTVRSATYSPSLGGRNIAVGHVAADATDVGSTLAIDIRGTLHTATVTPLPFYRRPRKTV